MWNHQNECAVMWEFTTENDCMYPCKRHYRKRNGEKGYMLERMEGSTTGVQVSSIYILIEQNRTE